MKSVSIYNEKHQWIYFGRDPDKPEKIIESNQFMIINNGQAILLDPGGVELFGRGLVGPGWQRPYAGDLHGCVHRAADCREADG